MPNCAFPARRNRKRGKNKHFLLMSSKVLLASTALSVIFLDRLTKILVIGRAREAEGFPVLTGVFYITRVNNTGAAFGLMKNSEPWLTTISVLIIFVIATGFIRTFKEARTDRNQDGPASPVSYGWALVLAGALGNLYDRFRYGYVIDFLDFRFWPVFNVADTSICVGVALVILHFFLHSRRRS